jgi:hypothetical protein
MLPKPDKTLEEVSPYRPISLLPVTNKVFKKSISRDYGLIRRKINLPGPSVWIFAVTLPSEK